MNASRFLDTNIILYAYDLDAPAKRRKALQLVQAGWDALGEAAISVQVLQELQVNLVRRGQSVTEAGQVVRDFSLWPVVDNTLPLLHSALEMQVRWQISLWDSLILAAAHAANARELLSEDFNHGQDYNGVRVINPFR
jgi:predicted nucleic acid-binding protein